MFLHSTCVVWSTFKSFLDLLRSIWLFIPVREDRALFLLRVCSIPCLQLCFVSTLLLNILNLNLLYMLQCTTKCGHLYTVLFVPVCARCGSPAGHALSPLPQCSVVSAAPSPHPLSGWEISSGGWSPPGVPESAGPLGTFVFLSPCSKFVIGLDQPQVMSYCLLELEENVKC